MNRLLLAIVLLSASGWGQSLFTTATATPVQDPNSVAYVNGTYNISYVPAPGGLNRSGNYAIAPSAVTGTLDSFGNMSVSLLDNSQISPVGSQWRFSICAASGVTCFSVNITISGASQDITAALKAAAATLPSTSGSAAGANRQVQFNNSGAFAGNAGLTFNSGTGTLTATHITGLDNKPYIDIVRDCGAVGDGVTDDGPAIQACFDAHPQHGFFFPKTIANGCSYYSAQTLYPKGSGVQIMGESGSQYLDDVVSAHMGGTEICFPTGITGFWLAIANTQGLAIRNIAIRGAAGIKSLTVPTGISVPSDLPQTTRTISAIQRASNILSVTIIRTAGGEGMNIQVGSTVKITGVVSDTTMNGLCVISTLGNLGGGASTANPSSFTCSQNGSNTGPYAEGTTVVPTTGANADGIRICTNFVTLDHVSVIGFERHGVNGDSTSGHGCAAPFSDDESIRDSMFMENGGSGVLCQGVDCNAWLLSGNTYYYNFLWGVEDQSSLGNTHVGNQISNNGHLWSITSTPATKNISTISRTLSGGDSTVTVVLSSADTNIKLGSCVVIAGVTDTSFNTANVNPSGCYFITSYTDSTHFQYIQPGRPVDASSSGGTERMAKFSEAYLAAGVDDGAEKIDTQSAVADPLILNQYIEGGQFCKSFGALHIQGASIPVCAPADDFQPGIITTTGCVSGDICLATPFSFVFQKLTDAADNVAILKSGKSAYKGSRIEWWDKDNVINWKVNGSTSASSGATAFWDLTSGAGQSRVTVFGAGSTVINAEGSGGKVIFNKNFAGSNAGTGGIEVQSGGSSPAVVSTIDGAGLGTFNGGVKVASGAQALTSVQGSTGTKVVAATGAFVSGNCTKTDANGNLVDAATTCGGGAGADLVQTFCTGTATSSVTRGMYPWGAAAMTTSTCAVGYSSASELPLARAGTIKNLSVKCATGGSAAGSGVFTVMKNNASAGVTCTVGTGTTCSDTSNTNATAANDTVGLQFTTQAAETLANCRASFEIQ